MSPNRMLQSKASVNNLNIRKFYSSFCWNKLNTLMQITSHVREEQQQLLLLIVDSIILLMIIGKLFRYFKNDILSTMPTTL